MPTDSEILDAVIRRNAKYNSMTLGDLYLRMEAQDAENERLRSALTVVKEWYDGNWVRSKKALRPVVEIVDAALNPKYAHEP